MIARRNFILGSAAAASVIAFGRRADADLPRSAVDPASTLPQPSLRVRLGRGDAIATARDRFTYNGRAYRGEFTTAPDGSIVNLVGIEAYLYGVVTHEMPSSWPGAALRAQAICARTFVLQRSNPQRAYDVVPSEVDQVYRGIDGETPTGNASVDATAGMVLQYDGAFAQALYSSCCGGHTESASAAWSGAPIPYLMGVRCGFCTASPQYDWNATLAVGTISQVFSTELAALGPLQNLRISERDRSGRARTVEFVTALGSAFVKGTAFRDRIGVSTVPSTLITQIAQEPPPIPEPPMTLGLTGRGLGHGVGLCQWGARGMALAGHTTQDIIALYFPGTDITHA